MVGKPYKCVNCGVEASALYRTYGTVIKLTKCENCKGFVDKYIEYDPVIVMIDLILISKEAQRHVLYNTDFKSFWKLLITLMMLETYGVWKSDSLFNIAINSMCGIAGNNTINITNLHAYITTPELSKNNCMAWTHDNRDDNNDLFIWEKDFYIQFMSTLAGIFVFVATTQLLMTSFKLVMSQSEVPILRCLKAFSLADVSVLFTLPMLVWGTDTSLETRLVHYGLVLSYSFVVFTNVFTVLYECPVFVAALTVVAGYMAKYTTSYHTTPLLRIYIT